MKTITNNLKHITIFFVMLLFFCSLKAQTSSKAKILSPFSRLTFCKEDGENYTFKYNFKDSDTDSISFIISGIFDGKEKLITFKKNSNEKISLRMTEPHIIIKYSYNGKEVSREVNFYCYPCDGYGGNKNKSPRVNKNKRNSINNRSVQSTPKNTTNGGIDP